MNLSNITDKKDLIEVVKKGGVALFIRILGFLSGYAFIYFTVNYFGAETQGRLSLSFSFMILGSLVCRLGMDVNFVKVFAISNNFENARGIFFRVTPYVFLFTLIVSGLVFGFADQISRHFFDDPGLTPFLKWTAPCIMLFTFVLLNAGVLRGLKLNALYAFLFNGGRFMFSMIFFFVFLFIIGRDPKIAVIAHTTAIFGLFAISLFFIRKYIFPHQRQTVYKIKSFITDSFPMLLSASMIVFLGWADTIILGIYWDSGEVGKYSVILKIAAVTSFTLQALDSILAPKLSTAFHDKKMKLFKKLVYFVTMVNFIFSVTIVVGILIFKDFILGLFGVEFLTASTALIILCLGQLFNAAVGPVGSIFQMTGNQIIFQNILFVSLIINITLNLILVQEHGITGVAIATASSLIFSKLVSLYFIKKKVWSLK